MPRHTAQDEQVGEYVDDVVGIQPPRHADGQHLAGEFIDDVQHPDLSLIMHTILDKVVGPDMVGTLRLQPDTGAVI